MQPASRISFLALILAAASCKHGGEYVWVDQYKLAKPADRTYEVAPGDLVAVRVLGHDDLSTRAKVRADGRLSIPYLDDVEVAGQAPAQIAEKLRREFLQFVAHPVVTVTVDEPRPFTVPVTGEVTRPGVYALDSPAGVLQALWAFRTRARGPRRRSRAPGTRRTGAPPPTRSSWFRSSVGRSSTRRSCTTCRESTSSRPRSTVRARRAPTAERASS